MSYKSREKKRRAKIAISKALTEHVETIKGRHYLTIVSRAGCCNACGKSLRKGAKCIFRFEPKEILCVICAELRGVRSRPSRRWEKQERRRRRPVSRERT